MAEDVYIQGFGDKGIPDFATEKTLSDLLAVMTSSGIKGLKAKDLDKLVDAIGDGDTKSISALLKILKTNQDSIKTQKTVATVLNKQKDDIAKLREENRKANNQEKKDNAELKDSMDSFSGVMKEIQAGLKSGELGFGQALEESGNGLSTALDGLAAGVKSTPWARIAGVVVDLGTAVYGAAKGLNAFAIQAGEDRFNLANEIRQSGLATSLTTADSGLVNFSEMVNRSSFTLGQAAEFTNKFSAAVGDAGIERSLALVNDLAYGGAEGADMMRRFGMEFGGIANVAGQYLDTVKNLGMLDSMNNQQLRGGMEDFMDTVTVTSNVMKVNLQDAAEMIANTLNQRDDLTAMLATLPTDMRNQVTSVVGSMGAQGTVVEEALAMFLASGDMSNFMTTQTGQDLAGSQFGQQLLPLIESMGSQIQSGGDLGQIIANSETALQAILNSAQDSGNSQLIIQGQDQLGMNLIAQIQRNLGRIGDANAGNRADTRVEGLEDDKTIVDRAMVQQEYDLAMENISTAMVKAADFASNLDYLNRQNLGFIQELEELAVSGIGVAGETIADVTFTVEGGIAAIGTTLGSVANKLGDLISEDIAETSRLVQEGNRQAAEMLGLETSAGSRAPAVPEPVRTEKQQADHDSAQAAVQAAALEQENAAEKRLWENGILEGPVPEQFRDYDIEFDPKTVTDLLNDRDNLEPIIDNQFQVFPEFYPTLYMELPQEFINDWNEKVRIENARESILTKHLTDNDENRRLLSSLESNIGASNDISMAEPVVVTTEVPEIAEPIVVNDIQLQPPEAVVIDNTQIKIPEPVVINEDTGETEVRDEPIIIERREELGETGKTFDDMLLAYLGAVGNMEDFINSAEGQLIANDTKANNMLPLLQQIGDGILDQSSIRGDGTVSQASMLDSGTEEDRQLYRDFENYRKEMVSTIHQELNNADEELTGRDVSQLMSKLNREDAEIEATRLAYGKFADEINEGGFGQVDVQSVVLPEEIMSLLTNNQVTEDETQRATFVGPDFIQDAYDTLTASSTGTIEDFINQLGIENTAIDFDLASEKTQAQISEFQIIAENLHSQNALSQERLEEILRVIQETNTNYRFGFNREENTTRETGEKDALIAKMEQLIEAINGN